ncbi:conserved hypothetical protein [Xenorhabdus nematophila F1]|nr:conserved hypothetical protein [Xenorhabdus nematophila F1]
MQVVATVSVIIFKQKDREKWLFWQVFFGSSYYPVNVLAR